MLRNQRFVLVVAILASFVAFLDGSVINVALPAISAELGGGLSTQQWVVDAYLITLGSLILLAGSLSDVFGRIVIVRVGLIGFGVASLLIAVAPTAEFLIAFRGLQGVAGALLVPSSLALIMSSFRGAAQAHAIGQWTAWTSAAFLVGPVLGGLFVDLLSWRLVFAINVIPIAVTLWMIVLLGHKDERKANTRIDYLGAVLGIVGLGGPVFALIEQGNYGWGSPVVFVPLVVGILSLVAFVFWQSRAPQPMLPLELFRHRNFSMGNIATMFIYGGLALGGFIVVIYLQEVAGYSATFAALAFLPSSIGIILLSSYFGRLSGRYGPRWFMTLGPLLGASGYITFLGMGESVNYVTEVLPGVLLFAVGMSMTVAPLTSAILGAISAEQAGIGSAVNNAVSRIAGLITVALIGVIVVGPLAPENFHRVVIVMASLLFAGALVSFLGIRNPSSVDPAIPDAAPPLS
ncbi:DHA2 family efflux MFS transporter permease subunit [Salinibacterium sp. SWN248]|uniref:DHA2 family efflux MFS transporter permease subunit n=1 Tax=Salinibacterium sp. SWN248 TaxID=2792056 RepID=UPI0018CFD294|nr:DHA2 family efflux MFS transporter permease subunit [Salinibacterium sp. SWN248]MBH0023907.1 DHA2 family efflux MFS transporter permease subunit [Salinibacterium sp. SWN248]